MAILARILRDRGMVTERQLQEAIQHQVLYGGRLGTSLYELGFITEERLQEALARARGVPAASVDPREITPEVLATLPRTLAAKHKVFPYRIQGKTLFLLMVDPDDHATVAQVGYTLGFIVKPLVVPEFRMIQLLRDYYGIDERWRYTDTRRPPPPPAEAATPDARLDAADTREEIVEALLALGRRFFRRVVFFIVREPWVLGWTGGGEGMDRSLASELRFALDQPSAFQAAVRDKTVFIGRLGADAESQRFLKALGKRPNTNAAIIPVLIKGRVVNLLYGDAGAGGNVRGDLGELMALIQKVPRAYMRIIRRRIAETRKEAAAAANPVEDGR
jgi:hypothetical protein